jgi:hypothetical protein
MLHGCVVQHNRACVSDIKRNQCHQSLSRVKSGGGAVYVFSNAGRIACNDVGLFEAFPCL